MMPTQPPLLVEKKEGIARLTLNRPAAMNALSRELRGAIHDTFRALAEEPDTGVVILTGAGRAFCAGLDLKELGGEVEPEVSGGATEEANMIRALWECPIPIIGAVNGFAITGGFELALACDFLIASTAARFADTHARVGIVPGWGLSQLLPRRIGAGRAKELSFTGNFIDAQRAEAWGLVNRVVPPEALLPTSTQLGADILSCDSPTVRAIKHVYDEGGKMGLGDALRFEAMASRRHSESVKPGDVAARRRAIQQRGRRQTGHA